MIKFFEKCRSVLIELTKTALTFLCLGIIVQSLVDDKLLGWDPVGNIQDAGGSFIGVLVLVLLYQLYYKKTEKQANVLLTSFLLFQYLLLKVPQAE